MPRKIETVPAILTLRSLAFKSGFINPRHKEVDQMFIRYGHAVPINEETIRKRESLGLVALPSTVYSFKEALEEIQKLVKKWFRQKVGFSRGE